MTSDHYSSPAPLVASLLQVVHTWAVMRSKDPSTKVGACIYDQRTGGLFLGYNGFPAGFPDSRDIWDNRNPDVGLTKYDLVIHAEHNAILKALKAGINMKETMLVCTHIPCPKCMRDVIAANGIPNVYYRTPTFNSFSTRDRAVVHQIADIAGINLIQVEEA